MSNVFGMDISQVRQLASQLDQKAEEIRNLMNQLTGALQGTPWMGPDRQRFEEDWRSTYCQQLTHVAQGLSDAANRARANAQQQEQASNA